MTTTTHRNDYADMIWGLQIDGYQRSARLNEIDAAVIAELGCDVCGGTCRYEAWRRQSPRGYRALSICQECGCVNEV